MRLEEKPASTGEKMFVAFEGDCPIGFITKYANTKTEQHPWKAFYYTTRPINGRVAVSVMLGTYFAKNGKAQALKAIKDKYEE